MDKNFYKKVDKLNDISIKDFSGIPLGELFSTFIDDWKEWQQRLNFVRLLKDYNYLCHQWLNIEKYGDGKLLFFTSIYCNRTDHLKRFKDLFQLSNNGFFIEPMEKKRFNFSFFIRTYKIGKWFIKFKKKGFSFYESLFFSIRLLHIYTEINFLLENLKSEDIKLGLVISDVHPVEYYLINQLKNKNITTATIQHGHFFSNSYVYEYSRSNYFLAIGKFSKSLAVKYGLNEKNVLEMGFWGYLNINKDRKVDNNLFCVFLNGGIDAEDNIGMLLMATQVAKEFNLKYIIRKHPADKTDYGKYIEKKILVEELDSESIFRKIKFGICGNSTVYLDMLFREIPCVRFCDKRENYFPNTTVVTCYEQFDWKKFIFNGSLSNLIDRVQYMPDESPKTLYKTFLSSFLK